MTQWGKDPNAEGADKNDPPSHEPEQSEPWGAATPAQQADEPHREDAGATGEPDAWNPPPSQPDPWGAPAQHGQQSQPGQPDPWGAPAGQSQPGQPDPWGAPAQHGQQSQPGQSDPWGAPAGQSQPGQPDPWGAPAGQSQPGQPDPWGAPAGPGQPGQSDPWGQTQYSQQQPPPYGQQPPSFGQPQQPYGQPGYPPGSYPPGGYGAAPAYSSYGQPPSPAGGVPASMGNRFLALLVDWAIVFIPYWIIYGIALAAFVSKARTTCDTSTGAFQCHTTGGGGGGIVLLLELVGVVAGFAYFGYFNGVKQQTIGKRLMKIKVVDGATGGPIGIGRALLRYLVLGVTGSICTLGYWSPFFDGTKRYQGWHDKAASSFVVTAAE